MSVRIRGCSISGSELTLSIFIVVSGPGWICVARLEDRLV